MVSYVEDLGPEHHRQPLDGPSTLRPSPAVGNVIEIAVLDHAELPAAAGVLARAMRDTPMSVAVHGVDPARRLRELEAVFAAMLAAPAPATLCARKGERLVGIAGLHEPHGCRRGSNLHLALALIRTRVRPATAWRFGRWRREWAAHDLNEPHWHLGPLAVEPTLRGQGIGSRLVDAVCGQADASDGVLYLETDTLRNVRFYEQWGFIVASQGVVLNRPNWFMRRPAGPPT